MQSVTIELPDKLYQRMRKRALERNRTVDDEVVSTLERILAADVAPPIEELLAQLPHLPEVNLLRAAQMRVPDEKSERMNELLWKQQAEGLTLAEEDEATLLQNYAQQVMLIRAEAAALLAGRGHDVSRLIASAGE